MTQADSDARGGSLQEKCATSRGEMLLEQNRVNEQDRAVTTNYSYFRNRSACDALKRSVKRTISKPPSKLLNPIS